MNGGLVGKAGASEEQGVAQAKRMCGGFLRKLLKAIFLALPYTASPRPWGRGGFSYFALAIFLKDPPCPPTHPWLYKLQGPQKLDFPLGM